MAPVEVQLLDPSLAEGGRVVVEADTDTPMLEIKRQLHLATGVPLEHIKVVLSGIDQLVMGDKRQMRFGYCGSASNIYFAVAAAKKDAGAKP